MKLLVKFRGKRIDNGEWISGYYCYIGQINKRKHLIIPGYASSFYELEVIPESVGRFTGRKDKQGNEIYQGHIVKSVLDGTQLVIGYGEHDAYCSHDNTWMTNIGFYAEDEHGNKLPLGPTEEWALIIGDSYA